MVSCVFLAAGHLSHAGDESGRHCSVPVNAGRGRCVRDRVYVQHFLHEKHDESQPIQTAEADHTGTPEEQPDIAPETAPQLSEKGKLTEEKDNLKITFKRREITDIIGDTLTNNEVAEYFYYCLQRTDMLEEWRRMYSEVGPDDEAGNA